MAKKERIVIRRDDDFLDVDVELDSALSQLDNANQKVDELLLSIETDNLLMMSKGTEMDENGEIIQDEAASAPVQEPEQAKTSE